MTPEGWAPALLSEAAEVVMGQSPPGDAYNSVGNGVPLLNGPTEFGPVHPSPAQWTTLPTKFANAGDVLFCVRGSTTGRQNVADRRYCIGRGLAAIRGKPDRAHTPFLRHVLARLAEDVLREARGSGSTFPNITADRLHAQLIALPPLGEQKKIAAVLSSVDEVIEATQAVIDQLQVVKKAMMFELLTRGLPGRHTRFKQTEIGEVPEEWEVVRMEALAIPDGMVGGPFGSDLTSKDYVPSPGVPIIRGGNVSMGRFHESDFVFVSDQKARSLARNAAKPGDIVMTQRGVSLGEATVIPAAPRWNAFIISQTMMRMTPDASKVSPQFLIHYTCSPCAQSWLSNHAIATGQPHLNLGIYRDLPAVVPARDEQQAIAEVLDRVSQTLDANVSLDDGLRRIKRGLMSVLLTGEIRVKQDTSRDDPDCVATRRRM